MPQLEVLTNNEMNLNRNLDLVQASVSSILQQPEVPKGGALVKVCFAGACYSEGHVRRRGYRPRFPGYEISGIIYEVCNSLPNRNLNPGDRIILYPDEEIADSGYAEFLPISDVSKIYQLPSNMSLAVAAMLPGGGLTGYSAVLKAQPHIERLAATKPIVNVLVVGAGGLGLWTLRMAEYLLGEHNTNVRVFVADSNIDRLLTAQDHGCYDIIHWNEEDHEEYICERTMETCRGGVDVIIDFVSSRRTMNRSLQVLNNDGLIIVGGSSVTEMSINLNVLSAKQQSISSIPKGSPEQLAELVQYVSSGRVSPPSYAVFPVEDANQVFEDLSLARITGRAILRLTNTNVDN
ncbi:uncharacterized protein LOC115224228 [Argonauta hians]